MRRLIFFVFIISSFFSLAQKMTINHQVYNEWKSLKNATLSNDGNYVAFTINPHKGDGFLYWRNNETARVDSMKRGNKPIFSHDNDFLCFLITPGYDTLRNLELEKVKKEKWVKDSLTIIDLKNDTVFKLPNIKSFKLAELSSSMAYLQHENKPENDEVEERKKEKKFKLFKKDKNDDEELESDGKLLTVLNLETKKQVQFYDVTSYHFNRQGNTLFFTTHKKVDGKDSLCIYLLSLDDFSEIRPPLHFSALGQCDFSFQGDRLSFLASKDTVKENKNYDLYLWDLKKDSPDLIIDTNRSDLPKGSTVSNFRKPMFSRNGKRLFIGLNEIPLPPKEDTLLESEKAKLDLWHFNDKQLQPQQLKQKKKEENKTWLSVLHFDNDALIQLGNDTLDVSLNDFGNSDFALGKSKERYSGMYNWVYPWPSDYYRIDVRTGERILLKDSIAYHKGLSPKGRYFIYYDSAMDHYMYVDNKAEAERCITCFMKDTTIVWTQDINGMPHDPAPYSSPGFTKDDYSIILHSEYDVWEAELTGNNLMPITLKEGKNLNTVMRLKSWEKDSTYVDLQHSYIHGVDKDSKNERIIAIPSGTKKNVVGAIFDTPHKINNIQKAAESNRIIYQKMNVKDYPDLYVNTVNFDNEEKISNVNPQQKNYRWPTVEKIVWTSPAGKKLEGLIYKPEDFDPTKSYPLLVYFYELYGDRKHYHYIPKPTASIIYATEYTSAEYVVFIPDIRYDEGYPARGAYDCIMSGTDLVLEMYPNIDSTRMGLQGQSWGGYQTAQLITMTNRFKAAMAGAPVSNMFSAYGGIRWGSGLNRQFQYERTQSRIGHTIWDAPELYRKNSPIFGVPKIKTPLLIMHNDNDGAVPWYQGIELFVGMKRLGKPAWLLNYNGDEHNLMKNANREDLSIRMRQFFDYYLQGKPAPKWLIEGIPAVDKGSDYKLELLPED